MRRYPQSSLLEMTPMCCSARDTLPYDAPRIISEARRCPLEVATPYGTAKTPTSVFGKLPSDASKEVELGHQACRAQGRGLHQRVLPEAARQVKQGSGRAQFPQARRELGEDGEVCQGETA